MSGPRLVLDALGADAAPPPAPLGAVSKAMRFGTSGLLVVETEGGDVLLYVPDSREWFRLAVKW